MEKRVRDGEWRMRVREGVENESEGCGSGE